MISIDNRLNVIMTRGDTVSLNLRIKDKSTGEYTSFEVGDVVTFAIARQCCNGEEPSSLTRSVNVDVASDSIVMLILPEDTKALPFGEYVYDVQIDRSGYVETIISPRRWRIDCEASR